MWFLDLFLREFPCFMARDSRNQFSALFQYFLVLKKKRAEILSTSLLKIRDKTLSKQKVNLLISVSVSSPHLNCKHLAYVTQPAIAGI